MKFNEYVESEKLYIVSFTYNSENILDNIKISGKSESEIFNKALTLIVKKFKDFNIIKSYSHLKSYYMKHKDRYEINLVQPIFKNKVSLIQGSLFDK